MARLPQLVDALTLADGRDRATIDNIARSIREDGLLPTTLRGPGAAAMTVPNAADLLIAANMPVPRGEAASAAEQFRTLRRQGGPDSKASGVFKALGEAETFGAALEVLIAQADVLADAFMAWTDDAYSNVPAPERYTLCLPKLWVDFRSPVPWAEIALAFDRGQGAQAETAYRYMVDIDRFMAGFYTAGSRSKADRAITVRVGLPTMLRLHDTLFKDGADG